MRFLLIGSLVLFLMGCSTFRGGSSFELRPFEELSLSNGLKVLYVRDSSLPYFSVSMLMEGGAALDTEELSGLANFVSELLRKGTKDKSAIQLAEELDFIGADFGASVSNDFTQISASSLSFHQEKLLKLYAEMITQPAFHSSEVRRLRQNVQARLKKLVDNPGGFASRVAMKFLYEDHPYSRPVLGTKKGVASIRQKHINRFFLRNYRPNKSILVVVGKLDGDIHQKVEKAFGGWAQRPDEKVTYDKFPPIAGRKVLLVNKPSSVQAQVRIGLPGIQRKNPDFLALRLANTILGGGFASRLNDRIRDDLGLTYSVRSSVDARKFQGPIMVSTFTRNEKVRTIIDESIQILQKFHTEGVSEKEVSQAKGLVKGRFPRSIETAERLAFNLAYLRFHDLGDEYLKSFIENVDSLSVSDVNRAIKKYFNPTNMKIVVFGDEKAIAKQLDGVGEVKKVGFKGFQ